MVDYNLTIFRWQGFNTYNTTYTATIHDDDANLDWFGQDTGTPETITIDGTLYNVSGSGTILVDYTDNDNGGVLVTGEEMLFMQVPGSPGSGGWMMVPMNGSSFTPGDTLLAFTTNLWLDTNGVPYSDFVCFTPGCMIDTPSGPRLVESLQVGDNVNTADNGVQAIRWVGCSNVPTPQMQLQPELKPVRIRKDAFGEGLPTQDMWVSPQHRILVSGYWANLGFGEAEVFAPAKGLITDQSVLVDTSVMNVDYIHILFDQHQVIFANGIRTESFHPGPTALSTVSAASRHELFTLFPEMAVDPAHYGQAARMCLKVKEAQILHSQILS